MKHSVSFVLIFSFYPLLFANPNRQIPTSGQILNPNREITQYQELNKSRMLVINMAYGLVLDQCNNDKAMAGVSAQIKGTSIGTITDFDGIYTISPIPTTPSTVTLVFSYNGYKTKEVVIAASYDCDGEICTLQVPDVRLECDILI